jgi:hypothetical protein
LLHSGPAEEILRSKTQCCIIRSVPAGTDGKSRTGMLTGTSHPYVPPRPKSRPVPACFGRFGLFRPVILFRPITFQAFAHCFCHLQPPPAVQSSPPKALFLLLPSSFFFFILPSSSFFRPALSLSLTLCTFSLPFFFLFFGSSAVIAVKPEMKKKKRQKKWIQYSGREV